MIKSENSLVEEALFLCDKIATFSAKRNSIERFCLSPQMADVHQYLTDYFVDSLEAENDRVGNILFVPKKIQGENKAPKRKVLIGSHLDTVSNAGRYDGILGVVIGLLCAREYTNNDIQFDAVGFADEEGGRFGCRFLGSLNFIGQLPADYLPQQDTKGISLEQALLTDVREDFSDYFTSDNDVKNTFIELHIEQGLNLHQADKSLGIVKQICGQAVVSLIFKGKTAHAVSKLPRKDALLSACEFVSQVQKFRKYAPDLHLTVGAIENFPNQSNVVSSQTVVRVDVRHIEDKIRAEVIEKMIALARETCSSLSTELAYDISEQKTVFMDGSMTKNLKDLCHSETISHQMMTSYAGHDALIMSSKISTGFLFLRDDKGISHHPEESVDKQAIGDAFRVLSELVNNC
jgi:allantoate deiminase